jgi:hypothetical protein
VTSNVSVDVLANKPRFGETTNRVRNLGLKARQEQTAINRLKGNEPRTKYLRRKNFEVINSKGEVMDTKKISWKKYNKSNLPFKQTLIQNIQVPCDPVQAQNFKTYIRQFAQRRNITLDIFPESMVKWINEDAKD